MDIPGAAEHSPHIVAAKQAMAEVVKERMITKHYIQVVRQASKQLHRHGLGQALAFIQMRYADQPRSPYALLERQLDRWILASQRVSERSALAAIASRDSDFYLEASKQAWLFLRAVREESEAAK